jgi:hypothetical protein
MSRTFVTMEERNDIVIYQSEDGLVRMEAVKSLKNKFGGSDLFGVEKDASFHSSIGQMGQSAFPTHPSWRLR